MTEQLTLENCWNDLKEKYPTAMEYFCTWIDAYKERVKWNELFYNCNVVMGHGWNETRAIKYHDIPGEMQFGIFMEFFIHSKTHFKSLAMEHEIDYSGGQFSDGPTKWEDFAIAVIKDMEKILTTLPALK